MLSYIARYKYVLSDIIRRCQLLFDIVRHCQIKSDIVRYYAIYYQILLNIASFCLLFSDFLNWVYCAYISFKSDVSYVFLHCVVSL